MEDCKAYNLWFASNTESEDDVRTFCSLCSSVEYISIPPQPKSTWALYELSEEERSRACIDNDWVGQSFCNCGPSRCERGQFCHNNECHDACSRESCNFHGIDNNPVDGCEDCTCDRHWYGNQCSITDRESISSMKVAFCHPVLFGRTNVTRLNTFLDYYRLLGFDHFYFWTEPDRRVEDFLSRQSDVSVSRFDSEAEISMYGFENFPPRYGGGEADHYHGQNVAIHSCLKQTQAAGYDWVLFGDNDEFLFYHGDFDLRNFLARFSQFSAVSLGKVLHTREVCTETEEENDLFKFLYRAESGFCSEIDFNRDFDNCESYYGRRKYFVQPQYINKLQIHEPTLFEGQMVDVDVNTAHMKEIVGYNQFQECDRTDDAISMQMSYMPADFHGDLSSYFTLDGKLQVVYDFEFENWLQRLYRTSVSAKTIESEIAKFQQYMDKVFEDPCSNDVMLVQNWVTCGFGCSMTAYFSQVLEAYFRGETFVLGRHHLDYARYFQQVFKDEAFPICFEDEIVESKPVLETTNPHDFFVKRIKNADVERRFRPFFHLIASSVWDQLKAPTKSYVADALTQANLPEQYTAMHVRRDDKCLAEANCVGLTQYFDHLQDTSTPVFVMSDEKPDVLEVEVDILLNEVDATVASLRADDVEDLRYLVAEISAAMRGHEIVCTGSSNICRLLWAVSDLSTIIHNVDTNSILCGDARNPECLIKATVDYFNPEFDSSVKQSEFGSMQVESSDVGLKVLEAKVAHSRTIQERRVLQDVVQRAPSAMSTQVPDANDGGVSMPNGCTIQLYASGSRCNQDALLDVNILQPFSEMDCAYRALSIGGNFFSYRDDDLQRMKCEVPTLSLSPDACEASADVAERWDVYYVDCPNGFSATSSTEWHDDCSYELVNEGKRCQIEDNRMSQRYTPQQCAIAAVEAGAEFYNYRENQEKCEIVPSADSNYEDCIVSPFDYQLWDVYITTCPNLNIQSHTPGPVPESTDAPEKPETTELVETTGASLVRTEAPETTTTTTTPTPTEPTELPECTCTSYESSAVDGSVMCQFGTNCALGSAFEGGCPSNAITCTLTVEEPVVTEPVTDPCACPSGQGYSSSEGMCMEGSTTECYECPSMEGCVVGSCSQECYEFDSSRTCQCLAGDCGEYGNCCLDVDMCDMECSPNSQNQLGLLCTDGTFGADGDFSACGGMELRVACPVQGTTTPYTCNSGSCEASAADCPDGVRYGITLCEVDPCACPEGQGFSSSEGVCQEGSTTECFECPSMDQCEPGSCTEECYEYDPTKVCQCLAGDCVSYGTCCDDVDMCETQCNPNTDNPYGLLCSDGSMGLDGDWNACGGYENREACPTMGTSTPITCNSGSCESTAANCVDGVRYGSEACPIDDSDAPIAQVCQMGYCVGHDVTLDTCEANAFGASGGESDLLEILQGVAPSRCFERCEELPLCTHFTISVMKGLETAICWMLNGKLYDAGYEWEYFTGTTFEQPTTYCISKNNYHAMYMTCNGAGCSVEQEIPNFPGGSITIDLTGDFGCDDEKAFVFINEEFVGYCGSTSCGSPDRCGTFSVEASDMVTIRVSATPTANACEMEVMLTMEYAEIPVTFCDFLDPNGCPVSDWSSLPDCYDDLSDGDYCLAESKLPDGNYNYMIQNCGEENVFRMDCDGQTDGCTDDDQTVSTIFVDWMGVTHCASVNLRVNGITCDRTFASLVDEGYDWLFNDAEAAVELGSLADLCSCTCGESDEETTMEASTTTTTTAAPSCSDYTDPCDCIGECGWSTSMGMCMDASESSTNCVECPTLSTCVFGGCDVYGCGNFDDTQICGCDDSCDEYGNCCANYSEQCEDGDCVLTRVGIDMKCNFETRWDNGMDGTPESCAEVYIAEYGYTGFISYRNERCLYSPACDDPFLTVVEGESFPWELYTFDCSGVVTEAPFRCSDITNPCDCTGECGWSSGSNMCLEGSTTNCIECSDLDSCESGNCASYGCGTFSDTQVCTCTDDCDTYGNCCPDYEDTCVPDTTEAPTENCDGLVLIGTLMKCNVETRWVNGMDGTPETCAEIYAAEYGSTGFVSYRNGKCLYNAECPDPFRTAIDGESYPWELYTFGCPSEVSSCSEHTTPCDCTGECGWSTSLNMCMSGSTTNCVECSTMEGCVVGGCAAYGCGPFDVLSHVCGCDSECVTEGGCCPDYEDECVESSTGRNPVCRTVSSENIPSDATLTPTSTGDECHFPFTFRNVEYFSCTNVDELNPSNFWCDTDSSGSSWGYCNVDVCETVSVDRSTTTTELTGSGSFDTCVTFACEGNCRCADPEDTFQRMDASTTEECYEQSKSVGAEFFSFKQTNNFCRAWNECTRFDPAGEDWFTYRIGC